jgi:hypothetical protein
MLGYTATNYYLSGALSSRRKEEEEEQRRPPMMRHAFCAGEGEGLGRCRRVRVPLAVSLDRCLLLMSLVSVCPRPVRRPVTTPRHDLSVDLPGRRPIPRRHSTHQRLLRSVVVSSFLRCCIIVSMMVRASVARAWVATGRFIHLHKELFWASRLVLGSLG